MPRKRKTGMMNLLTLSHHMSESAWARHANPWSGWTRLPILPLLAFCIWARTWIGWYCLLPVGLLLAWTWLNPRAFAPPVSTANWMSRAVLGERDWLAADVTPIPSHHARAAVLLSGVAGLGLVPLAWGLWSLNAWAVLAGLALSVGGKLWFLDRMAWLHADMQRARDSAGQALAARVHPPHI